MYSTEGMSFIEAILRVSVSKYPRISFHNCQKIIAQLASQGTKQLKKLKCFQNHLLMQRNSI